jgi:hypothetical protein
MKKLTLWILAATVFFSFQSCDTKEALVNPTSANQDVLGVILPNSFSDAKSSKLIVLEDGRKINPISGIEGFSKRSYGAKLRVSFSETKNSNEVIDAAITSFSEAKGSTFEANAKDSISGKYKGSFVYIKSDTITSDTTGYYSGSPRVNFAKGKYNCTASKDLLGGSGRFNKTTDEITFTDANTWPVGIDMNLILNGKFKYMVTEKHLFMWANRNGNLITYVLKKE